MPYTKQTWVSNDSPLNATRLNHMEDGIADGVTKAEAADAKAVTADGKAVAAQNTANTAVSKAEAADAKAEAASLKTDVVSATSELPLEAKAIPAFFSKYVKTLTIAFKPANSDMTCPYKGYFQADGTFVADGYYSIPDYVEIPNKNAAIYYYVSSNVNRAPIIFYDENKEIVQIVVGTGSNIYMEGVMKVPANAKYLRCYFTMHGGADMQNNQKVVLLYDVFDHAFETIVAVNEMPTFYAGVVESDGSVDSSSSYKATDYVEVNEGDMISLKVYVQQYQTAVFRSQVAFYDANKNFVFCPVPNSGTGVTDIRYEYNNYTFLVPNGVKYVRISKDNDHKEGYLSIYRNLKYYLNKMQEQLDETLVFAASADIRDMFYGGE